MIVFPNAKVNLGLHILRKRADGYHDLETVFYPLRFHDALEVLPSAHFGVHHSGLPIPGEGTDNLCVRAYELLKRDFPRLPPIDLYLYKHIPMGAGLGGGSSDGAAMLQLLNRQFGLQLDLAALTAYAAILGSDCPFFLVNTPCLATGRGEILRQVRLDLSAYWILLVNPGIHVNTGQAFGRLRPAVPPKSVSDIISQPIETWREELHNDFEIPVTDMYPVLQPVKKALYQAGAIYASMSGSGSCFFGIFKSHAVPYLSFGPSFKTVLIK